MEGPSHARVRKVLARSFSPDAIEALRAPVEGVVDEHLGLLVSHGPPADLVRLVARPVPLRVLCELLGVPGADAAVFGDLVGIGFDNSMDVREKDERALRLISYAQDRLRPGRHRPGGLLDVLADGADCRKRRH
ncbi:hypothetical protein U9R90_00760 [Streptomyces sp. E11-3]|uniref:hypothetical protein n=1 Tax=Streptomyces sp. E11-3 TaxID=3110112 RepID=UPI00397FD5BE